MSPHLHAAPGAPEPSLPQAPRAENEGAGAGIALERLCPPRLSGRGQSDQEPGRDPTVWSVP